ncbi:alpha/beta hydrolase [Paradesulfitobacterium aromaticivorans]
MLMLGIHYCTSGMGGCSLKITKKMVEPFYFPGGATGCLLLHGFTGSPSEMRLLGEFLKEKGWTILGPKLSGHGSTPEELSGTGWEDWLRDAETGILRLREVCDRVIAVGLSMGGLLALNLASRGLVDGVISMNAPMILQDWRAKFALLYQPFKKYVDKPPKQLSSLQTGSRASSANADDGAAQTHLAYSANSELRISGSNSELERFVYERVPVTALTSLNRGIRQTRQGLKAISCPALLMQSVTDETVQPQSVELIASEIARGYGKPPIIYWKKSGHILTLGPEREQIAAEVARFIESIEPI